MFLAGANQEMPELRAPSFKGMLRFWWRAAAWARLADLDALSIRESEVFGSANGGRGIVVHVEPLSKPIPVDGPASWPQNSWQNYTGYGMLKAGMRPARAPIRAATEFRVVLLSTESALLDNDLQRALELLGTCGGLGAKSRNAWGSLSLLELEPANGWKKPGSATQLRATLDRLLRSDAPSPPFTAISRETQFAVGPEFPTAEQAHEFLATRYKECVGGRRVGAVKRGTPKELRGQFGLPRNFENTSAGAGDSKARRAKPLFLHVHDVVETARAFPLAVYMPGRFLPDPKRQEIPGGGNDARRFLGEVAGSGQ
jgi:CRISPR-associated protein Cmr1